MLKIELNFEKIKANNKNQLKVDDNFLVKYAKIINYFSIKDDIQFDDKLLTEDTIAFYQKYQLTTYEKNKRDFAFKIVAKYEVTFKQEQILSKEFWHIFSGLNLHINTWPYFREFVQNMTQRINVPPLTLQLLKK